MRHTARRGFLVCRHAMPARIGGPPLAGRIRMRANASACANGAFLLPWTFAFRQEVRNQSRHIGKHGPSSRISAIRKDPERFDVPGPIRFISIRRRCERSRKAAALRLGRRCRLGRFDVFAVEHLLHGGDRAFDLAVVGLARGQTLHLHARPQNHLDQRV